MNNHQSIFQTSNFLSTASILIGALAFAPYIVLLVVSPIAYQLPSIVRTSLSIIGLWQFLLSSLVLGHFVSYVLLCLGLLAFLATAFFVESLGWMRRIGLGMVGLAVLVFVFAPYRPSVSPTGEERMLVLTEPVPWLRGLRNAQAIGELVPCRYDILGWSGVTLFYRAECVGERIRVWQFTPESADRPAPFAKGAPDDLYVQRFDRDVLLRHLYAPDIFPISEEYAVRSLFVSASPLMSPDRTWLAFIAQRPYSVEDVVLIQTPVDKFVDGSN